MITDWETYSFRRDKLPPGYKDERGSRRYFEIVYLNKDRQVIGRGYNHMQCMEDRDRRKGLVENSPKDTATQERGVAS